MATANKFTALNKKIRLDLAFRVWIIERMVKPRPQPRSVLLWSMGLERTPSRKHSGGLGWASVRWHGTTRSLRSSIPNVNVVVDLCGFQWGLVLGAPSQSAAAEAVQNRQSGHLVYRPDRPKAAQS